MRIRHIFLRTFVIYRYFLFFHVFIIYYSSGNCHRISASRYFVITKHQFNIAFARNYLSKCYGNIFVYIDMIFRNSLVLYFMYKQYVTVSRFKR